MQRRSGMPPRHVVIAVLTFRRPDPLGRLLPMLLEQAKAVDEDLGIQSVRVIVIDNDPEGSARATVTSHRAAVDYFCEPRPGISHARNRALEEADGADLLIFIDDDETPQRGWLDTLIGTQQRYAAQAVAGRVISAPEGRTDPFVEAGGFLLRSHREGVKTGSRISRAATNNLLLDLHFVRSSGLHFDPRFGLTGGEDSHFTTALVRAGGALVWCAEAVVLDHVTIDRMTPEYMLRRARAMSSVEVRVDLAFCDSIWRRAACRSRRAARESARALVGAALILRGHTRRSLGDRARGHRAIARSRGAFGALLGRQVDHYAAGRSPTSPQNPTHQESSR